MDGRHPDSGSVAAGAVARCLTEFAAVDRWLAERAARIAEPAEDELEADWRRHCAQLRHRGMRDRAWREDALLDEGFSAAARRLGAGGR